ncbi:MAG: MBL fold metallo-hydrolase [Sporichthyaceae bacterium]
MNDWTEPGAFEVAPGVHRVPLPLPNDGLAAVNVYVLDGGAEGGCVLIDSGWSLPQARAELEAALDSIGYGFGDVRRFLTTHYHRDHYTLGVELRRTFGTRIAIGSGEAENIEASGIPDPSRALAFLRRWGAAELAETWGKVYDAAARSVDAAKYEAPDEWIADDGLLDGGKRTLKAIRTPGHTSGHLVFLDEAANVMFTGDHVLPHITPSIGFENARTLDPLGAYLNSLHLMLRHADALMLPAHGAAGGSVHARVRDLIAHHDRRLAETLAAVQAGAGTPYEAAQRIGWTSRNRAFESMDLFNQILATSETYAHLRVLADRGEIRGGLTDAELFVYEPVDPAVTPES